MDSNGEDHFGGKVVLLNDCDGMERIFLVEAFSNGYQVLTLSKHSAARAPQIVVPISIGSLRRSV